MHPKEPPRLRLPQLPTPIVELPAIAKNAGIPRLLLKRDDLTGFEISGNKVRKLEYVLADAQANGATSIITHGGYQSNHCRASAALGARLGMHVRLLLRCADPNPPKLGNLFLDHLFGATISVHSPEDYSQRRKELVEAAMQEERDAGRKPYFFPVGASIPLGCWGYIRCIAELVEQLGRETAVDLFCATGSAGTQAGLILGKTLFRCDHWRILGVPICDSVDYFQKEIRELIRQTVAQYSLGLDDDDMPIELLDGFIGDGYAIPYPEELDTIRQAARLEGVLLDPTYTGKAFTGMLAMIRGGDLRKNAVPLFVHTGGVFGMLAHCEHFE